LLIVLLTFTMGVTTTTDTQPTCGVTDDGGCCCDRYCEDISVWCCPVAHIPNDSKMVAK